MFSRKIFPLTAGVLLWPAFLAAAEQAPSDALTQELLAEIRQLKARVTELETKLPRNQEPSPRPVAPALEAAHVAPEPEPDDPHASHMPLSAPSLSFHGYADLGYRAITANSGTNSFRLGQADLFITSRLSDKLSFLMETAIDSDQSNTPGIEIERLLLNYRQNEYLNVSMGRYHSAIGYFNGAFHHGRWFQTAVDRPFLFEFEDEGGILPIHNVGVSASGRVPSGGLRLNYVVEIGNGRSYIPNTEIVQTRFSANNGKSFNVALYASPHNLPGWQFGSSVYRNRVMPDGFHPIEQKIISGHAVYERERTEFLNEFVLMQNTRLSGSASYVPGFYTQLAYRMGSASRPYFRWEYLNASASDPVVGPLLGSGGHRQAFTAGYRYDLAEFCAIKFQLERIRRGTLGTSTEGAVQLSFAF